MRRLAVLLLVIVPLLLAAAPPAVVGTALFGWSWGDGVAADMVDEHARMGAGAAMFKRPGVRFDLDGVPLAAVHFVFENGRLGGFSIRVEAARKDALVAALDRRWGAHVARPDGTFGWTGPTQMASLAPLTGRADFVLSVYPRPDQPRKIVVEPFAVRAR